MSIPDLSLDSHQLSFERDIRRFLENDVSSEDLLSPTAHADEHSTVIYRRMADRGWLGMNLPREVGGQGRGAVELAIFRDWTSYYRVPLGGFTAASRVAHAIHILGTAEQQQELLPRLVSGDLLLCIGYTEPDAGSDLAALTTRAVSDGDVFHVNGQKIFTTAAHLADYVFLACRTDAQAARHRGLSVLLVDLKSDGVSVHPIWTLGGWRLNTIFLDDVVVPRSQLVGELHGGWRVIRTALDVERTGMQPVGAARRLVDDLWQLVDREADALATSADRASALLSDVEAEVAAARTSAYRLAWQQDRGHVSTTESAVSKLLGSEAYQRAAHSARLIIGAQFFEIQDEVGGHALEREYRYAPQSTIAAGTSEIMRNLIAKEGLGLPVR